MGGNGEERERGGGPGLGGSRNQDEVAAEGGDFLAFIRGKAGLADAWEFQVCGAVGDLPGQDAIGEVPEDVAGGVGDAATVALVFDGDCG